VHLTCSQFQTSIGGNCAPSGAVAATTESIEMTGRDAGSAVVPAPDAFVGERAPGA